MNSPRVLATVGDMDGCTLWRVLLPITELQRQGYQLIEWGNKDDDQLYKVAPQFQAIVLPRLAWSMEEQENADRFLWAVHRAGLAVFYEIDDDLVSHDFIQRLTVTHGKSLAEATARRVSILDTIRKCDGITCSSQRLATLLREYVELPIQVVQNYIDLRWFKRVQKQVSRQVPGITIGWAGGNRPEADVMEMAEAWGRIARKYPQTMFVIQGHQAPVFYEKLPPERIAALPWMPIDSYPSGLVNIDIGCCPLGNTPFNRCKTPIKAMEYAASGAAVVASPTIYKQIIQDGATGFIVEGADEWERALSQLVESYSLRRELARALRYEVRSKWSLERNAWRWPVAWSNLLEEFESRRRAAPKIWLPKGASRNAVSR